MGIFVPCLIVAFSLFCVTTRGLERSLPTPFDSAAVMKKSIAKLGERCENPNPEVGVPAEKFVLSGRPVEIPFPDVTPDATLTGFGGTPAPGVTPLPPTAGTPEKSERPPVVEPAKPSSVRMVGASERDVETTRASI